MPHYFSLKTHFFSFDFGVRHSSAHGLLLVLQREITPSSLKGAYGMIGIDSVLATCHVSTPPDMLLL